MGLLLVRDRETGGERQVTEKAYSIIPHRYIVLAKIDDAGNQQSYAAPAQKKSAHPAAAAEIPSFENQIDEVKEHVTPIVEQSAPVEEPAAEVKIKKKPGRKPSTIKNSANG